MNIHSNKATSTTANVTVDKEEEEHVKVAQSRGPELILYISGADLTVAVHLRFKQHL